MVRRPMSISCGTVAVPGCPRNPEAAGLFPVGDGFGSPGPHRVFQRFGIGLDHIAQNLGTVRERALLLNDFADQRFGNKMRGIHGDYVAIGKLGGQLGFIGDS